MNYCLVAAPAISLPFVFMAKEEYRRSSLDKECSGEKSLLINNSSKYDDEIWSQFYLTISRLFNVDVVRFNFYLLLCSMRSFPLPRLVLQKVKCDVII